APGAPAQQPCLLPRDAPGQREPAQDRGSPRRDQVPDPDPRRGARRAHAGPDGRGSEQGHPRLIHEDHPQLRPLLHLRAARGGRARHRLVPQGLRRVEGRIEQPPFIYRVGSRKKIYTSLDELRVDLYAWLVDAARVEAPPMTTAIAVPRDTEFTWRARRRAS